MSERRKTTTTVETKMSYNLTEIREMIDAVHPSDRHEGERITFVCVTGHDGDTKLHVTLQKVEGVSDAS